jgi:hypothetical protein
VARSAALALVVIALGLAVAAPAQAGWTRPQRIAGPYRLDVLPAQVAFSSDGQAAIGFGVQDEDRPSTSQAIETIRSARGKLARPRTIPSAQQVLDLAFDGSNLSLLTGSSPVRNACCSSAGLVKVVKGKPRPARIVVKGLTGASDGRLLTLRKGRLLAAVATPEGVWVQQARASGRPAAAHLLTPPAAVPQTLAATSLGANKTLVGWTAAAAQPAPAQPSSIVVAGGTASRAPHSPRIALSATPGHAIEELALGRAKAGASAAWIESFYDAAGILHSQVAVADLGQRVHVRTFPIDGLLASGLSLASNASGAQMIAWKVCDASGSCSVETVARDRGRRFGQPLRLGRTDASQSPCAAVSTSGAAVVGWIDGGRVLVAAHSRRARRFARARVISSTNAAADLTLGFGASHGGLAAWTQGVTSETVMAASFRP